MSKIIDTGYIPKEIHFTEIKNISDDVDRCTIVYNVIECLPGWFILPLEANQYSQMAKDSIVYAAYLESTPVGFLELKLKRPHVAEVLAMGVICGYQHLGMGRQLMEHAFSYCEQNDIDVLEVKTADYSDPDVKYIATRKFYERMGFVALDTIERYWADGTPVLIMVRKFDSKEKLNNQTLLA
ncbi:MAG: GNAT family N-acetyltransferase [Bacilli bacterium]|nr:GNAT family N-acetyltransferase [Bacilli bacterium]MCH4202433.1 GNAT family N-acetyltransferase [Bacilli bacterium]MCH4235218.1 GNAT family N-acetyltransferase [Bacilli bacterium]